MRRGFAAPGPGQSCEAGSGAEIGEVGGGFFCHPWHLQFVQTGAELRAGGKNPSLVACRAAIS
jgi:hypothetical protein